MCKFLRTIGDVKHAPHYFLQDCLKYADLLQGASALAASPLAELGQ